MEDCGWKVYETENIEAAVELAYKLKAEGHYNWFRGQVRDKPPVSSLYRVFASGDSEKKEKALSRIKMFFDWVGQIPELRFLQEPGYVHDIFAIMQHYGIPTHYIDFTTDPAVAGFFAADTSNPPTEGKSCIYCLNTEDLISDWNTIKDIDSRKEFSIELVRIDVLNLWRLQAQRGVFLFADYNWQIDYPMDRILFPYSGYQSYPTREQIYPEHKSPLEQLLDQYFFLEAATSSDEEMQRWVEELKARGGNASYRRWETWSEGFYADALNKESNLVPLKSWSSEVLRPWEIAPEEDYYQTIGPTKKLKPQAGAEEIREAMSSGIKSILRSDPTIRSKTVDWEFPELPESLSQDQLNDMLRPVWNGMRRLPYTEVEIADAFGSVAMLLMLGFSREDSFTEQMKLFSQCFGECVKVEFASQDLSGSRGLVARESLQKALRPDIAELLAPSYKERANDFHILFQIIYNPRLMFEFNEFISMFAQEVIPTQVMMQRDLILFNPVRLKNFGLP
jgi:FRG domain